MPTWHGYLAVQDLALTDTQRTVIWGQLQQLGAPNDPSPARRCHWRRSLDDKTRIFEAAFDSDNLTIEATTARLAAIFDVPIDNITHTTQTPTFDQLPTQVVTFHYNATPRFRLAAFATLAATWLQSQREALAYIIANPDQWDLDE